MKLAVLEDALARRDSGEPFCLITDLTTGAQRLVDPGAERLTDIEAAAVRRALATDRCELVEHAGRRVFVRPHNPPLRMVLVGGVHIAQALGRMAALAGWEVTVVDPRSSWASDARFPGIALRNEWPDRALEQLRLDARTAVAVLSHDAKIDDRALIAALRSDAFYVGALGSRKTHQRRLERLRTTGLSDGALARIRAPIGLAIGARSPAEIAVAILAEVTEQLRKRPPLRRVAALVLAAGRSSRMGADNKLLARVDGSPMVGRVVDALQRSRVSSVYVVTGHDEARIRDALAGMDVRFVPNPEHARGMSSSIRAGLAALPADTDGVVVALGDMPWVRPGHIDALIDAFDPDGRAPICVPVYERKRGNPVLWARRYFDEMRALQGDVGARELLDAHAPDVHHVQVGDPGVTVDVDTPEALSELRGR